MKIYILCFIDKNMFIKEGKRGQAAIFIIVAVVIVVAIIGYFIIRSNVDLVSENPEVSEVLEYYTQCIENEAEIAVSIAGTQGGRVYVSDFFPGSEFAPFSNTLNFLGFPVPYWYYISANWIVKESVPTRTEIENDIARYIEENLANCDFNEFYEREYSIQLDEPEVKVVLRDASVDVNVNSALSVSRGDLTGKKSNYDIRIDSKLGKFYNLAKGVYNKQKSEAFLESYAIDTLRLNAPVDGVEIQCNPKIWKTEEVMDQVKEGLESNIQSLKLEGNYYSLNSDQNKYFVINHKTDESVNFIYSRDWPSRMEVYGEGVDRELMVAEAIGNKEGLGLLGFCYVPYHFVYDISFPVMVQFYSGDEIFQFPVVVIIDKNKAREAEIFSLAEEIETDVCKYKTQPLNVNLYNSNLNRVDGNVSLICFDKECRLGESKGGVLNSLAPSCLNGYLRVKSEGYKEKKELVSTNSESSIEVILDREYEVELKINSNGNLLNKDVVVIFTDENQNSVSAFLPEIKTVKLSQGSYKVKAYAYANSSIKIPSSTKTQCQDIPKSGLLGIFGATKKQCFNIEIPEVVIDYGLIGGGQSEEYFLESELSRGVATIYIQNFDIPRSIEELQNNYAALEASSLILGFE